MSTREVIGGVTITGPNARGRYKLRWTESVGRSVDTSGGKTLDAARAPRDAQRHPHRADH